MMAARKTTRKAKARKRTVRATRARRATRATREPLERAWTAALDAIHTAQKEAESQLETLLKRYKIRSRDAAGIVRELRTRFDKERKQAMKEIGAQLATLETRVVRERKAFGRSLDHAVRNGLATLNIPSRKEVAELTRKVDLLSKKIDGLKRR
jgi:poly(hydroxyalkanoate) granule-associated protein